MLLSLLARGQVGYYRAPRSRVFERTASCTKRKSARTPCSPTSDSPPTLAPIIAQRRVHGECIRAPLIQRFTPPRLAKYTHVVRRTRLRARSPFQLNLY